MGWRSCQDGHEGNCHQLRCDLIPPDGDAWRDGEREEGAERDALMSLLAL